MEVAINNLIEGQAERCAEIIVKYQKFTTNKVLEKFIEQNLLYSKATATSYINYGIAYIMYGTKHYAVPKKIYNAIDECIAKHIQPLTPSEKDKRRIIKNKYQKKDAVLPVQKIPEVKTELTEKFEYGVRIDNRIILFSTENGMNEFVRNIKFVNPETYIQAVEVTCLGYRK